MIVRWLHWLCLKKSTLWSCRDILSLWDGTHMYTVWYCIDFIDFYQIMDKVVGQILKKLKKSIEWSCRDSLYIQDDSYNHTVWYGIDFIDFVSDHGYVRWTNLKHIKKNDHCDRALTSLTCLKKLKQINMVIVRW